MRATDRRPRLLALGYNIYGSGLTRVMRMLTAHWADRYDIDVVGIGNASPAYVENGVNFHPTNTSGGGDAFGAFQTLDMVEENPPDILFILHDIWMFEYYSRMFKHLKPQIKLVGYIPLDGNIHDPNLVAPLSELSLVVVYTDWAAAELRRAFDVLIDRGDLDHAPPIKVMFHGVDTRTFAPSSDLIDAGFVDKGRLTAKRDVFGDAEWVDDSFIVLNAARPAVRKRVDLTIAGFAKFVGNRPGRAKLCLHHAITEPETEDLLSMIESLGITDDVIYNPLNPDGGPLNDADLARLYAACDVGINTAMGEGWGLVSFEHASTGAAQIVPNHTACRALWNNTTAEFVEPEEWFIPNFSPLELGQVSAEGVANALDRVYVDAARRADLAKSGCAFVNRREFQWSHIAAAFDAAFSEMIG